MLISVSIKLVRSLLIPPHNVFFIDGFERGIRFSNCAATVRSKADWSIKIEPCKLYSFPFSEMATRLRLFHVG